MKKPKKHKELSAEKMKRYLNNHLSYRERHFIESNALNNAFQRDALDGFEENPEVVWHNVKLDLHRRLAQRLYKEKHQFMLLTLRRWAAIFILLFTASTLYWFLEQQQREKISEVAEASPLSEKDTMSRDAAMSFSTDTLNGTISAKSFQESSSRLAISAK
ncbi:MAG: hypothetical protein NZ521_12110, partial [Flammeovirgaceae bacterium]|nr:hypothetical protein [Flammeovirgaceae bacterium]